MLPNWSPLQNFQFKALLHDNLKPTFSFLALQALFYADSTFRVVQTRLKFYHP